MKTNKILLSIMLYLTALMIFINNNLDYSGYSLLILIISLFSTNKYNDGKELLLLYILPAILIVHLSINILIQTILYKNNEFYIITSIIGVIEFSLIIFGLIYKWFFIGIKMNNLFDSDVSLNDILTERRNVDSNNFS